MLAVSVRPYENEACDPAAVLTTAERAAFLGFQFGARRQSYLAGRMAAKEAVQMAHPDLDLNEIEITNSQNPETKGAPRLRLRGCDVVGRHISLTHGKGMAAAVYSDRRNCGLDIDTVETRADSFYQESCNPSEYKLIDSLAGDARDLTGTLIWTGKEAMSKVLEKGLTLSTQEMALELESTEFTDWLKKPEGYLKSTGWVLDKANKFGLLSHVMEGASKKFILTLAWKISNLKG